MDKLARQGRSPVPIRWGTWIPTPGNPYPHPLGNLEYMVHVPERREIWEPGLAFVKIVFAIALIYGLVVGTLHVFQRRILFVPGTTPPDRAEAGVPDMREVDLRTVDGLRIRSWYRPATPGLPTLIYFQGNAGTMAGRGFKARPLMDHGYGLLMVGYRGYGGNPGHPSEAGLIEDGRAALAFLAGDGVGIADTVLYGESLGSGVAVALAAEAPEGGAPGAIILEAPFTSIVELAAARYWFAPVRLLLKDRFETLSIISRVHAPTLILHGERDGLIDVDHARRLHEAANEPKRLRLFNDGRHSNLYDHGALEAVVEFLDAMWDRSQAAPRVTPSP